MTFKNITIVGGGYVGMSLAALLGQKYSVTIIDTDQSKVNKINNQESCIEDRLISDFLANGKTSINASSDHHHHLKKQTFIFWHCLLITTKKQIILM